MRPVLLGMNNPRSDDPRHALFPHPPGCAGWRLWQLSGVSMGRWMNSFDRQNILMGREWSADAAMESARRIRVDLRDRVVVMCGAETARCMVGLPPPLFAWRRTVQSGVTYDGWWASFPHPSGRNRDLNDPLVQAACRVFLEELIL